RRAFFFSSRRRHTRWPRDWSSDVCSSDLDVAVPRLNDGLPSAASAVVADRLARVPRYTRHARERDVFVLSLVGAGDDRPGVAVRSEERRVGKERRGRGSAAEATKKDDTNA